MNVIKFVRNRATASNPYQDLDGGQISGLDASIKQECDDIFGDFGDRRTDAVPENETASERSLEKLIYRV
jgi:hypothetical protein